MRQFERFVGAPVVKAAPPPRSAFLKAAGRLVTTFARHYHMTDRPDPARYQPLKIRPLRWELFTFGIVVSYLTSCRGYVSLAPTTKLKLHKAVTGGRIGRHYHGTVVSELQGLDKKQTVIQGSRWNGRPRGRPTH